MLLGFVAVVIAITYVQKRRSERSLEALRDLSSPRALVMRDGQAVRIAGRELVVDDVVLLAEGDRVPADLRLLDASSLTVDESLLTGESVPVMKHAVTGPEGAAEETGARVFSGTLVTAGHRAGHRGGHRRTQRPGPHRRSRCRPSRPGRRRSSGRPSASSPGWPCSAWAWPPASPWPGA